MTQEALRMAIEALEENHHLIEEHERPEYLVHYDQIISLLAKALAQEQEPVAHCTVRPLRGDESYPKTEIVWAKGRPIAGALYTYPPQRTEQDPVAWLCKPDENGLFGLPTPDKGCQDCFPVYQHPQRTWVGLAAGEMKK